MSRPLGFLETSKPILYASDATASLLLDTYDVHRSRGSGWRTACLDFETKALARADRVAVSSDFTRRSAIEDHHADPTKVSVVPMGANVEIDRDARITIPAVSPTTADLRLLLVAADPERKRLCFCIEIIDELRLRGWHATLHYIGPERPACGHAAVEWAGALRLGDPEDRARHRELLRACHLAILPSRAEMFGISPIESAGFGRPAVVSDVGGLPTVVKDGVTGRVVPVERPPAVWCDAIEAMISRPDRYADFSQRAFDRCVDELNWDAWGRTVRSLAEELV
ncbi:MAG: glycosyltransferase family 4 protein [Phycisphaera sp.]|nr:glycosyltransferase family 4 protein [Phycisphaera sp.]